MSKPLTRKELIDVMRKRQGNELQKDFAARLGISQVYLCNIYQGKAEPGPKVLEALGFRAEIIYRLEQQTA